MIIKGLIAFAFIGFGWTGISNAGTAVQWKSTGHLISLLVNSELSGITLDGYKGDDALDLLKSRCVANVYRPDSNEGAVINSDNKILCKLINKDGSEGSLLLKLDKVPIMFWGNSSDALNFQIKDSKYAPMLFNAIKKVYNKTPRMPRLSKVKVSGPFGNFVSEAYYINDSDEELSAADLFCDQQLEKTPDGNGFHVYQTRCVFLFL